MKTFAACLLAATTVAVPIQEGALTDSGVLNNLSNKIADKVDTGDITVIDPYNTKVETKHSAAPVVNSDAQVDAVLEQVQAGFDAIAYLNQEIEIDLLEVAHEQQQDIIEEILADAEDRAGEAISSYSEQSELEDEIEEIFDSAARKIQEVNYEHDVQVAEAAKTAFVAEITNDTIKESLMEEINVKVSEGVDVNVVIAAHDLPFNVQTPPLQDDQEDAATKLDRIVCRSGDCAESIKSDPEFDSFLKEVLDSHSIADVVATIEYGTIDHNPAAIASLVEPSRPAAPKRQQPVAPRRVQPKPQPKPVAKPAARPMPQPKPAARPMPQPKPVARPQPKPVARPVAKPVAQPVAQPETPEQSYGHVSKPARQTRPDYAQTEFYGEESRPDYAQTEFYEEQESRPDYAQNDFYGEESRPDYAQNEFYEQESRPDYAQNEFYEQESRPDYAQADFYRGQQYNQRPGAPERPGAVDAVKDARYRDQINSDSQIDRHDRSTQSYRPDFGYQPDYTGPGDVSVDINEERSKNSYTRGSGSYRGSTDYSRGPYDKERSVRTERTSPTDYRSKPEPKQRSVRDVRESRGSRPSERAERSKRAPRAQRARKSDANVFGDKGAFKAPEAPTDRFNAPDAPTSLYGAPSRPTSGYGAPSRPASGFNAPSRPASGYNNQYGDNSYEAPARPESPEASYDAPGRPEDVGFKGTERPEGVGYRSFDGPSHGYGGYEAPKRPAFSNSQPKQAKTDSEFGKGSFDMSDFLM